MESHEIQKLNRVRTLIKQIKLAKLFNTFLFKSDSSCPVRNRISNFLGKSLRQFFMISEISSTIHNFRHHD